MLGKVLYLFLVLQILNLAYRFTSQNEGTYVLETFARKTFVLIKIVLHPEILYAMIFTNSLHVNEKSLPSGFVLEYQK